MTATALDIPAERVEGVLAAHGVRGQQVPAVPAQLTVGRLRFSGTKQLTGADPDGAPADGQHFTVPFVFDWTVGPGAWGVGTEQNLRGKTSILKVLEWGLRGRCTVAPDVRQWLEHAVLDFTIDAVPYTVDFTMVDGEPTGRLERAGQPARVLAHFDTDDSFEQVMDEFMLRALSLPVIVSAQQESRAEHRWPTYAGALFIHGETLPILVGDNTFGGLAARLLSMFSGSPWAAARAQCGTALKLANAAQSRRQAVAAQVSSERRRALDDEAGRSRAELAAARAAAAAAPDLLVRDVQDAAATIANLEQQIAAAEEHLQRAQAGMNLVTGQLVEARAEAVAQAEDEHARRFFHALNPTMCPRCSVPISAEQRQRERNAHQCSLCASDLRDDAPDQLRSVASADTGHEDPDDPVTDVEALEEAVAEASETARRWRSELVRLRTERAQVAAALDPSTLARQAATAQQARDRLARAEGHAAALEAMLEQLDDKDREDDTDELRILGRATKIVDKLDQEHQGVVLASLSTQVTSLARQFGMVNLERVSLSGNGAMKVRKGGAETTYGQCERGEQLRLKLATAIALIQQGRGGDQGRHPGLLFIDAPKAEEVDDPTFSAVLSALRTVATEGDIQVIVATRDPDSLERVLGADRCRVARGSRYAW